MHLRVIMYDYDYLDEKAKPYGGIKKIFDELSDYADEFIIGYLESRCGCRVSKDDVIKERNIHSCKEIGGNYGKRKQT